MSRETRRLRRDLNVSDPTAGIVVPAETMFVFNGSSADLAQQFYQRYEAGATVAKLEIAAKALPAPVQARLAAADLKFKHLHPLLQRALLWDSGYVFVTDGRGGVSDKLVRVLTANGTSMADIALSFTEFSKVAGCAATNCSTAAASAQRSTGGVCNGASLAPVLKCAVEGEVLSTADGQAFWATGGHEKAIPELSVARHSWQDADSKQTYTLNAIHSLALSAEASVDCAATAGGQYASLIIPCAQYSSSSASQTWADPAPGKLVTVWLQHARANKPGFNQYYTLLIIAAVVASLVLLLVICCSCKSRCQKRKQRREEAKMTSADPSALLESNEKIEVSAVALTPVHAILESDLEVSGSSDDWKSVFVTSHIVGGRRLRMDQLALKKLVAHGASGSEIWAAKYRGSRVAVKRRAAEAPPATPTAPSVPVGAEGGSQPANATAPAATSTAPPEISAEIQLLASLRHRNIVRFYGVAWNSPETLCVVTEYARKGCLEAYLRPSSVRRSNGGSSIPTSDNSLTWTQVEKIMMGIADAVQYLHTRTSPVAHGSIEAKNVLLSSHFEPKLIGVGAAATSTLEDDICALGVLFAELIALGDHHSHAARASLSQEEHKTDSENLPPPPSPECAQEIRDIVAQCMAADPSARPSIRDVVRVFQSSSASAGGIPSAE